ncbi:hypothetical protein [cyanobacterium endosymbiont of Rhopalodia gibberula]|uniref:hypothetical protein n=1 Tax=cyanobacterium endosymbiont of Rhopalodia gibberula TaxID=1763363 RepID=UPI001559BDFE|nr:hypothetical protein [cyanobacterium endosymbiont of Rhopalodia gibberula]
MQSQNYVELRTWCLLLRVFQGWNLKNSVFAVGINYDDSGRIVIRYNESGK